MSRKGLKTWAKEVEPKNVSMQHNLRSKRASKKVPFLLEIKGKRTFLEPLFASKKVLRGIFCGFSRRFRDGISFPNFVERSILKLPVSKISAVPFALENRSHSEGENRAKRCPEKGRKRGGQQRGQRGKKE